MLPSFPSGHAGLLGNQGKVVSKFEEAAGKRFDEGLYCAESVLSTIAEHLDIESDLIPRIATGFCSGMSRTAGTCGAVTGAVLGLNLAFGRSGVSESVEDSYEAVQDFIEQFHQTNGSINCAQLLGCDLGNEEGQQAFREANLGKKCRKFTGEAAGIAIRIIEAKRQP